MDRFWTVEGFMNNCINHPDAQIVDFNILNRHKFEPKVVHHPIGKLDYDPNALITTRIPNIPGEPNTEPLLMVPFDSNLSGVPNYPEKVYHLDAMCSCHNIPAGLYEAYLQLAFGRLEQKDQDTFRGLVNSYELDKSGPLTGIGMTNQVIIWLQNSDNVTDFVQYGCVMKAMSRMNHSCLPNSTYFFDMTSFAFYLTAAKDIVKGDQIFRSNHNSNHTTIDERRAILTHFDLLELVQLELGGEKRVIDLDEKIAQHLKEEANSIMNEMNRWGMNTDKCYPEVVTFAEFLMLPEQVSDPWR
ncbi:hypothetical protein BDQ17DRAFT_1437192 [Cyathus striatus]|nr:hypothetical protein BDQ17DRAFT_1437192 [Cyathus striatus]